MKTSHENLDDETEQKVCKAAQKRLETILEKS